MPSEEYTLIDLDGQRLLAAVVRAAAGGAEVVRCAVALRPTDVPGDSAQAVGVWAGAQLKAAGMSRRALVIAAPRGEVILKQLALQAGPDATEEEVSGMVKLAVLRQAAVGVDGGAIDYLPLGQRAAGEAMRVMAVAMPQPRREWWREFAAAAHGKVAKLGLRCSGVAAVLADESMTRDGALLGIVCGPSTTEMVIVEDGAPVFARAMPMGRTGGPTAQYAETTATEAKRTWMSFRAASPGGVCSGVCVLGDDEVSEVVGAKAAAELGAARIESQRLSRVKFGCEVGGEERSACTALAGLVLESAGGGRGLDLANPRKGPDKRAKARQLVLGGALGMILLGGVGYMVNDQGVRDLKKQVEKARAEETELRKQFEGFLSTHARAAHLKEWRATGTDWISHLAVLSEQVPDTERAQLDAVVGRLSRQSRVVYVPRSGRTYPEGQWRAERQSEFTLNGRANGQEPLAELRSNLVSLGGASTRIYDPVESKTPDGPDRFSLVVRSSLESARQEPARRGESAPKAEDAKGGAK